MTHRNLSTTISLVREPKLKYEGATIFFNKMIYPTFVGKNQVQRIYNEKLVLRFLNKNKQVTKPYT